MRIDASTLIALMALVGATAVACSGHDGWGWLIFIAFIAIT